jgi:hypothetical protein
MRAGLACLLAVGGSALGQQPADAIDPNARDEEYVATLSGPGGASATVGRVSVYVPAGTLSGDQLRELAESLSRGFEGLVAFTHSPRSWQRVPSNVSYYFHAEMTISHADPANDRLFIAFPRLSNGQAPLLHETVHVLLHPSAEYLAANPWYLDETVGSLWISEGLANYVGAMVAAKTGIAEGDPIGWGTLDDVDEKCTAVSLTPLAAEILPFVGAPGWPAAILSRSRRLEIAPPFYACSTSFTRFVVGAAGIEAVVDALAARDTEAAIAAAAGTSIGSLRADWRREIGASATRGGP